MEFDARISALEKEISKHSRKLKQLRSDLRKTILAKEQDAHTYPLLAPQASTDLSHALAGGVPDDWRTDVLSVLSAPSPPPSKYPLTQEEYKRYGRQLIMPEVGLQGQLRLKSRKVLIVGVGGLGCPAAAYLAGAGIGTVGLCDGDTVEESNLHRQILHSGEKVGMSKVESAVEYLKAYVENIIPLSIFFFQLDRQKLIKRARRLNPLVTYVSHPERLTPERALDLFRPYDVVLDCTDTPASRYLISDACVLLGKPLVSASALRTEGQLMVLNCPPRPIGDIAGGPCYRCVFPKPPPAESVVSCGDGGILGPVVGVMGVLQALEALKVILSGRTKALDRNGGNGTASQEPPQLLIFSAHSNPQFRSIRLRGRKPGCAACSSQAAITPQALTSGSLDYIQFCGVITPIQLLAPEERVSATALAEMQKVSTALGSSSAPFLIDVRERVQFDLCHLEGSHNIPFSELTSLAISDGANEDGRLHSVKQKLEALFHGQSDRLVCVVCRQGNDSQIAVKQFKLLGLDDGGKRWIGDLKGGLMAWRREIDHDFPDY
jgi:adenylyltransferase and sulfurtransferase